jgi:hypothetical protein
MLRDLECKNPLDPDVADSAPSDTALARYDEEHIMTSAVAGRGT